MSNTLGEKCSYPELFWSVFSRMWSTYGVSPRIKSKLGKILTRKTFPAVIITHKTEKLKTCVSIWSTVV